MECAAVCAYADEWIRRAGRRIRSYYICDGRNALIPSKVWGRKRKDVHAPKQAWYCVACGRRCRASSGQIVEILDPQGQLMWLPPMSQALTSRTSAPWPSIGIPATTSRTPRTP